MRRLILTCTALALASALASAAVSRLFAQENYQSWEVLKNPFESTGGGGVMIGEYNPVIVGNKCVTNFTATLPFTLAVTEEQQGRLKDQGAGQRDPTLLSARQLARVVPRVGREPEQGQ